MSIDPITSTPSLLVSIRMTGYEDKVLTNRDTKLISADAIRMEMQDGVRSLAMPVKAGESIKALWRKVARRTGFSERRVRTLWYGQADNIQAIELEIVRNMVEAERQVERAQTATRELWQEMADLRASIDKLRSDLRGMTDGQSGHGTVSEASRGSVGRAAPIDGTG